MKSEHKKFSSINPWYSLVIFILLTLLNCSSPPKTEFQSLIQHQPKVVEVKPNDQSKIQAQSIISLKFSDPIDFLTNDQRSIALLRGPLELSLLEDSKELTDQIIDQDLNSVDIQFIVNGDETEVSIMPTNALSDGVYHLVVTPKLRSTRGIPFNQIPGASPTVFVANFFVGQNMPTPQENDILITQDPSINSYQPGTAPNFLILNEFLYDGQESETDGECFIELYGTPGTDISFYYISLINGSNGEETDRIELPAESLLNEEGLFVIADLRTNSDTETTIPNFDYLDQFDPQNGPDAILLLDREGHIMDRVVYGEGAIETTPEGETLGEGNPAPDVKGGKSLSRTAGQDTNDNSQDFVELEEPTPGLL